MVGLYTSPGTIPSFLEMVGLYTSSGTIPSLLDMVGLYTSSGTIPSFLDMVGLYYTLVLVLYNNSYRFIDLEYRFIHMNEIN